MCLRVQQINVHFSKLLLMYKDSPQLCNIHDSLLHMKFCLINYAELLKKIRNSMSSLVRAGSVLTKYRGWQGRIYKDQLDHSYQGDGHFHNISLERGRLWCSWGFTKICVRMPYSAANARMRLQRPL